MKRALAIGLWLSLGCGSQTTADDWVPIKRDDLLLTVDVTGKLAAVNTDLLGPPPVPDMWDFKIATMAAEGSAVKKGDLVLAFDATELKRKLETKQNERDAVVKEIEKAESNARMSRRDEELRTAEAEAKVRKATLKLDRPNDLTGTLELATAKIDLDVAKNELDHEQKKSAEQKKLDDTILAALNDKRERAEARIREAQDYIRRMAIPSPRAATVIYVSNWNDQKKKVGDSAWRAEKVLETAMLDEMTAKGEVDEVDASKAAVGQRVTLRLDAAPDVPYAGTVKSIGTTVQRQSRKNPLKVVKLEITLDKTDAFRMRPGMRFKGAAETERIAKVLLVPTSAIFLTEHGPVAYRKKTRGFDVVDLKLGKRNKDYAEVLGGLAEGDEVSRIDLARSEAKK